MLDDFTAFRAAHPSVLQAIAGCDRPDWLVLLAWEAVDSKTAVSIGLGAAQLLSTASDTLALFKPNPDRLETVAAWTGDDDGDSERAATFARSLVLASFPAATLALVVVAAFMPGKWNGTHGLIQVGLMFVFELVFSVLVRRSIAAIVRRRAAQLDERAALDIVLDEVQKGAAAKPRFVPIVLKSTGGRLRRCLDALPE